MISIHALREEGDIPDGHGCAGADDFYPRPPRGGRHGATGIVDPKDNISIHALREEGDDVPVIFHRIGRISIHALREEGD